MPRDQHANSPIPLIEQPAARLHTILRGRQQEVLRFQIVGLHKIVLIKDGERLDIRTGDADPAAVARLERERDALDVSAAQRIADERRIAAQRDLPAWMTYPGGEDYVGALPAYDYAWMWWYPPFDRANPPRKPFPRD